MWCTVEYVGSKMIWPNINVCYFLCCFFVQRCLCTTSYTLSSSLVAQWMVLVPRVLEKVALGVQDKFASGSAVVKGLVKLFTATSSLKSKHNKIRKGLVVGDEAPTPMDGIISSLIVKALAPLNFVGNKLVWSKVQDGFGGRQRSIISGGSALAGSLETFYENCGIE